MTEDRRAAAPIHPPQTAAGHDARHAVLTQLLGLRAPGVGGWPVPLKSVPVDVGEGDGMSAAREHNNGQLSYRLGDHVPKKHGFVPDFRKGTEQPVPALSTAYEQSLCHARIVSKRHREKGDAFFRFRGAASALFK